MSDTLEMCRVTRTGFQLELKEPRNGMVAREQARRQLMSSLSARNQWEKTPILSGKGGSHHFHNPTREHQQIPETAHSEINPPKCIIWPSYSVYLG